MSIFKLVFSEEQSIVRHIEIDVEADTIEAAAEAAVKAYQEGKYDEKLEAVTGDTTECRNEVAYHTEEGEYVVLLPWD